MPCPRLESCRLNCLHRQLVQDYRAERERQEINLDNASLGYRAERADYLERRPLITFKSYLVGMAGWSGRRYQDVA